MKNGAEGQGGGVYKNEGRKVEGKNRIIYFLRTCYVAKFGIFANLVGRPGTHRVTVDVYDWFLKLVNSQFHQHFTSRFSPIFFCQKKINAKLLIEKSFAKALSYKKGPCKILMKLEIGMF